MILLTIILLVALFTVLGAWAHANNERNMLRSQAVFWQEQASEAREETYKVYMQFMHNMDFGEEDESEEEDDPLN